MQKFFYIVLLLTNYKWAQDAKKTQYKFAYDIQKGNIGVSIVSQEHIADHVNCQNRDSTIPVHKTKQLSKCSINSNV